MEGTAKMKAREILDCPLSDAEHVYVVTESSYLDYGDDENKESEVSEVDTTHANRHEATRWVTVLFLNMIEGWLGSKCQLDDEFLAIVEGASRDELAEKLFVFFWDNSERVFRGEDVDMIFKISIKKMRIGGSSTSYLESMSKRIAAAIREDRDDFGDSSKR